MLNVIFDGSNDNYPYPEEREKETEILTKYLGDMLEYFNNHQGVFTVHYDLPKGDVNRYSYYTNNNAEFVSLFAAYRRSLGDEKTPQ